MGQFETVMQTRDEVREGLHLTDENSPDLSRVILGYANTGKKIFYCFYKIFRKINSANEGKFCLLTSLTKKIFSIHALDNHLSY